MSETKLQHMELGEKRQQIAKDVAEFLARGGVIQQLEPSHPALAPKFKEESCATLGRLDD